MLIRSFLAVAGVLGLALASTQAMSADQFGAKLENNTQPSNAGKGHTCKNGKPECTWVLMQAFNCESGSCKKGHLAPRNGTLASVSIIACFSGTFVLQIARANSSTEEAQVIHSGPLINYQGDSQHCGGSTFDIETFPVTGVQVKKGDYLAVASQKVGFLRCDSGGTRTLLFVPPLPDGGPLRTAFDSDGCFMLLRATYTE
jgi:hypothetical protein